MADAIGVSYEMARRYAEGAAIPKPDTVRRIAGWLKCSPTWLMYGDGDMDAAGDIDIQALEACLQAVEKAQHLAGIDLPIAKLAPLVAGLYQQAVAGELPSPQTVATTLKALTR
jgi:transcriptional regulator with XRE-family HTH domain